MRPDERSGPRGFRFTYGYAALWAGCRPAAECQSAHLRRLAIPAQPDKLPHTLLSSLANSHGRLGFALHQLRFILAPRWAATLLNLLHPGRRTSPSAATVSSQPLEAKNSLLNLLSFLSEIRQHFCYVHILLSRSLKFPRRPSVCRSERRTKPANRKGLYESCTRFYLEIQGSCSAFRTKCTSLGKI